MQAPFNPEIQINYHIALLKLKELAIEEMGKHKGITQMSIRALGKMIMDELQKSKATMQANKTWIAEKPIDGRYRYSSMGHVGLHNMDEGMLEQYKRLAMGEIEQRIKQLWEERG